MDSRLMFWTADRVEQLNRLRADGLSGSQIAVEMGCSRNAVVGMIYRLKLPLPVCKQAAPHSPSEPRARPSKPLPRRNPSNYDILAKIAIAAAEPGLPERLKGDAPDGTGIKLHELTEFTCRFPRGDPKTPEFEFCGARAIEGCPYCAGHAALAYQPEYCRYRADKALLT